jgi:hypothetical protein
MMAAWWASSPYFDTNIYIGGDNLKSCKQPKYVNASWVTNIINQGWGVIPTWVGPQAPCTSGYAKYISYNPTTAKQQGVNEATKADTAAKRLGLQGTEIFYNMEPYSVSKNPTKCDLAVQAFLSGWVSQLQSEGYNYKAGVYGGPYAAAQDFANSNPMPDEVWIYDLGNKLGHNGEPTIWDLGKPPQNLPNDLWASNQRIHQFRQDNGEVWGGVGEADIDNDVEDTLVVGGNGQKPAYQITNFQFGSYQTFASDMNNFGTMVGYYETPPNAPCNSVTRTTVCGWYGKVGHLISLNANQNATETKAWGINNKADIVGEFQTAKTDQGCPQNTCGFFNDTVVLYPGATATFLTGVNNNGQAVGQADTTSGPISFIYDHGKITDLPPSLFGWGINDNRLVVGFNTAGQDGFIYSIETGYVSTIAYPSELTGINVSGQLVGRAGVRFSAVCVVADGENFITIPVAGCYPGHINKKGEFVGTSLTSSGVVAFIAVPVGQ